MGYNLNQTVMRSMKIILKKISAAKMIKIKQRGRQFIPKVAFSARGDSVSGAKMHRLESGVIP